jgi:hypothetical protein
MIMNDKDPVAVPNLIDTEVYGIVYDTVENQMLYNFDKSKDQYSEKFVKNDQSSFLMYIDGFDDYVYEYIQKESKEILEKDVSRPDVMFARFNSDDPNALNTLPKFDNVSRKNEVILVVQLDSTLSWDFYLDDKIAYTERNMGMFLFDQDGITWKPKEGFGNQDYLDILVCRMSVED